MVALNHEPADMDEGYPEGVYIFKVKELIFPHTFKSGNIGIRMQLDVWNKEGVGFVTWENIVTSLPKMKWKLKEFCSSLGIDFDKEDLDSDEFANKEGRAKMHRQPGDRWLSVDHYLSVDSPDIKVDESNNDVPF